MPPIKKKRSRKPFARAGSMHLLAAVVGAHTLAGASETVKHYRLQSAAKALDKELRDKKKRQTARLMLKAERIGALTPEDQARLREYGTARAYRVPARGHVKYIPEPTKVGQKPRYYFRKEVGVPLSKKKIPGAQLPRLITREKLERAKNSIRRVLGTTKAETNEIIARANRQVLKEFRAFKKTARYKNLSKSEKAKVKYSRWKRWTLTGISLVLGDSYE